MNGDVKIIPGLTITHSLITPNDIKQTNHHYNNANAVARPTTPVVQIPFIMDGNMFFTGLCFCQYNSEQLQSVFFNFVLMATGWLIFRIFQKVTESNFFKDMTL